MKTISNSLTVILFSVMALGQNLPNISTQTKGQLPTNRLNAQGVAGLCLQSDGLGGVVVQGCAASSSGTVTNFNAGNLSPIFTSNVTNPTTTPSLAFVLTNASAHTFLGNNTGTSATPGYVSITTADLPGLFSATIANVSHKWINSYSSVTGLFTQTQPDYSDLTGTPILASSLTNVIHKWLNSYNASTGLFTQTQPDYSDLTGVPTLPANTSVVSHQFFTAYNSSTGLFSATQPSTADLSDFPSQVSNSGKFLTTNGTVLSWGSSGTGTVTSFSSGNLSPLFTTSVATATTTPAQTFALSTATAHTFFGNNTGSTANPAYSSIGNGDLPGSGAITLNTTAPITGGGSVALGNALTFACSSCLTSVTAHNLLSATHGDTTAHAVLRGDLIAGIGASPTWTAVAKGGTNAYPKWNSSGDVIASTLAASGIGSPTTCTNQTVTAFTLNADAAPTSTCTTITNAFTTGTFPATAHNLLSSTHGDTTPGSVATGDVISGQASAWARLAGNSTTTPQYLKSLGSGAAANAPSWGQIAYTDLSGVPSTFAPAAHNILSTAHGDTTAAAAVRGDGFFAIGATPTWQRLAHSAATGGYFKWNGTDIIASTGAASGTGTCASHNFVTINNADASPTCTQPAAADLNDGTTGTGAVVRAISPALTGSPTSPTQATGDNSTLIATDQFVTTAINNAISGVNPAVAVQAASAAVLLNSPTYLNGASGIGATLTAGATNTALVVDGYTPVLQDRILVKNQASAFQNGVYFVSQVSGIGLAWILTRALDYDQPSDMNNTGAIPVINGTVNLDTSWVQTSLVTTVGTDAVTFTQFSLNPTTLVVNTRNINTTSPITGGGNLTADRTIACATCVTSTSPGAGIAHFAGSTQAVTSSAVTSADTTGTFPATAHNLLSSTHGDSTTGTVARGDVITGQGASPTWTRLAKGAANQALSMDGTATDILWSNVVTNFSAGDLSPIFTTTETTTTTTPALSFTLTNSAAHTFLGNNTGSTTAPAYVQPAFTDISGVGSCAQEPALTGDVTTSGCAATIANNAVTQAKVSGGYVDQTNTQSSIAGIKTFTSDIRFKSGVPWFDITSFGAACDGATDDTAAIQAAFNAAKALNATAWVFIPSRSTDCIIASTLDFHGAKGIRIGGIGGGNNTLPAPNILYTGSGTVGINCADCQGVTFQDMAILYNNAAFTGSLVDVSTSIGAGSNKFENVALSGFSTAKLATQLVLASSAQKLTFKHCTFGWAVNGINNAAGNVLTVEDSQFGNTSNVISGTYLLNTSAGARITGNNFEMFSVPNTSTILDTSGQGCFGCFFGGNWIGDMPVGYTGILIKATGGMAFVGNTFQGQASATMMQINGGQDGFTFTGNATQQAFSVVFSSNAAVTNALIAGNKWAGTLTTFYSGTLPSTGIMADNTGLLRVFGNQTITGNDSITGQIQAAAGSVSIPGYSFSGDTNTGMWEVAADHSIRLSSNGVLVNEFVQGQTRFGSSGTVGFTSTTDPSAATIDTNISRGAANLMYVGTGASGNKAGLIQSGNTMALTSDFTTASATLVTITGLSKALPALAATYDFECHLMYSQATAAAANAFGIQAATTSPTNLVANGIINTSATVFTSGVTANITNTTATNIVTFTPSAITTVWIAKLAGQIEVGASGSTLNVMALTGNTSDSLTVKRGSFCQIF